MVEQRDQQLAGHRGDQGGLSGKTVLFATLAGVALGGPLLGMMGFVFVATMTLVLVISPLLIIFSPILLGAAFVLMAVMAGFAAAGTMAIAGLSSLGWFLKTVQGEDGFGIGKLNPAWAVDKLTGSGEKMKQQQGQSELLTVEA